MHVGPLKKITIELYAITEETAESATKPATFTFIYGVSSLGLSTFEAILDKKQAGDWFTITVDTEDIDEILAHLQQPVMKALGVSQFPSACSLKGTIIKIETPEQREIIKAIARATSQDACGGDCGCGCQH